MLELGDPAFGDRVQGHWIEVMQLFAALPDRHDQRRLLQHMKMLGHSLASHVQMRGAWPASARSRHEAGPGATADRDPRAP